MKITRRALTLFLLLICAALPASARRLVIQHFDAQILVNADGTIDVTENIQAQFVGSNWHGLYRSIPIEYSTPEGLNYTLFLDVLSVTDSDGHKLRYEQAQQGRNTRLKIYVPDADDSTRTVVLTYRVHDAISFFEDHDELYWNLTGNDWDVPIESASANIVFPSGITGLHAIAYTGVLNSRQDDAKVDAKDNVVEVQTAGALGFHGGITVVAGFDKGFVHPPGAGEKIVLFLRSNWPLSIPFIVFAVMFYLYWTRGRDPEHGSVTVQYDPPDNLSPGECGTLVDNEAGMRDITATLVDLAVKGYLTIEQKDESHMLGLTHSKGYIFHMKKPAAEWGGARPHEQSMLVALFEAGATPDVTLASLQNRFYTSLPTIRDAIFDALMKDGYYLHRPDTVRQAYIGTGIVSAVLMIAGETWLSSVTGIAQLTWAIAGVLSGIIICVFGWFMPARTISGWRTLEKVLGFEQFLGRVEKDQIARLEKTPELFEKYLPYAMALHVEKKWVQAFSGIALQPPQWYQGGYGNSFVPYLFISDLNIMSMQAGSVMASSPRSSGGLGGSGFGGGGGSGGGFGGGGGGGF
jgi:uncharacterized membrane protein YgcG